jgi:Na+-translocating ferredoxin:NAD+ oxidoreductase RNF subunit RnfB
MLFIASKFFVTEVDPRLVELVTMLPGANCGACGFAGCARFAAGIIDGKAHPGACKVIDDATSTSIFSYLGLENDPRVRVVASLRCQGSKDVVQRRSRYQGVRSCRAAALFAGGDKACPQGCLGYGDCVAVCPFDAIHHGGDGIIVIDRKKCTGCGTCITECPKNVLSLIPRAARVSAACFSIERGKKVSEVCKKGCIACKRCEKVCPVDAIHVEDNRVNIDYEKCDNCGQCVDACPTGSLIRV